jgi:probable F420-dependent oxidoreductase
VTRPFRFAATPAMTITGAQDWRDTLRRMEDAGIATAVLSDHFTDGWSIEPLAGLAAAAMCTSTIRLQTGVLGNDYRHPVQTHRAAALIDVLSDGRLTLGLGAGWLRSDYDAAGIRMDPAGARIARLAESVAVITALFGDEPCTFVGEHYHVDALDGLPKPVQRPHPPLFLGGGSPRMLRLAGAVADVVGVNASLRAGALGAHAVHELVLDRVHEKLAWVREGAQRAGRGVDDYELEMNVWLVRVTASASDADGYLERIAGRYDVAPAVLAASPSVLVGTVEQCADMLLARRADLGINQWQLDAGMSVPDLDVIAPIIERVAAS